MMSASKYRTRAAIAPIVIGAVVMVLGGFTESQARGIRLDDPSDGGGNNWLTPTDTPPAASAFLPAGATGSPRIFEDTNPNELYDGFLPTPPLFAGYTDGFMYNWGSSQVTAQVLVYTGTDDGTGQVCDDAGDLCQSPGSSSTLATVTEIDFNYNTCVTGGKLTWDGVTYTNTSANTNDCDDAFMFVNGALFGTAPSGWVAGTTTTSAPEPATIALLGLGLGAFLVTRRRRQRQL